MKQLLWGDGAESVEEIDDESLSCGQGGIGFKHN